MTQIVLVKIWFMLNCVNFKEVIFRIRFKKKNGDIIKSEMVINK